jgi:hypothetical protein
MAELREGDPLVVALPPAERREDFHRHLWVAPDEVEEVRVGAGPSAELRGVRAPGTGIPGAIGVRSRRGGVHDVAAVPGRFPAVVVERHPGSQWPRPVARVADRAIAAARPARALDRPRTG